MTHIFDIIRIKIRNIFLFNNEHNPNIYHIFVILLIIKLLRFISIKDEHL